jgi:hypothetical protein
MPGLTADTEVEAVDGPSTIEELMGRGIPVLTRLPSGARGFRILFKVEASASRTPVVTIALDNGHGVTVAQDQIVYKIGMEPVRAGDLAAGDMLEPAFHYPPGYRLRDAGPEADGEAGPPGHRVVQVDGAGEAVVYSGRVKETGCGFLTAGILCRLG